ncbi:LPS-assembly protein LptD [Bartonella sp. F02]|uniref:LPS-assembly protein LptD n=1 Tax=Bartonella sp. F02 TaxID=2967262 RepID=UPI0022A94339|nr:LPS-assembly protein LptD [Bartonella sp. F02]MCZ2328564.1 LPS-assembly protein LptD [Bartonella sp. F02]
MKSLIRKRIILIQLKKIIKNSAIIFVLGVVTPSIAKEKDPLSFSTSNLQKPTNPLLLSADKLIYDRYKNAILAQGNVQIEYNGNKVVAQKITYNQKTKRVIAQGNVEIVQKDGNKIYSNQIDITQDFSEGFINFLRVETTNNTHFAAANAQRINNEITIFNNAIYTACAPNYCRVDHEVLWQIKAKKIIWNSVLKTVRFEDGYFEIFGMPIIRFPVFELPDPTVKRISGLLSPHFLYADYLGIGLKNSYFWNLSPHYDFTLSTTLYTQQGLLTEGEWRQQFKTGQYNIRFAHIHQINPHKFDNNTIDKENINRYMLATKGDFRINARWIYGWDIFTQSDQHFGRAYNLENYNNPVQLSQLYLNGLAGQNHFDMRFYHFTVQDLIRNNSLNKHYSRQAWALPRIDYSYIFDKSIYTGELSFHSNIQSIYRDHTEFDKINQQHYLLNSSRFYDIAGNSFRLTGEIEWKKRLKTKSGLILTPIFALRTDTIVTNTHENYNINTINNSRTNFNIASSAIRNMATAGLEVRYPLLITTKGSTQILEPTAQIFIRNNERYIGRLPNEDARSFIFDATTLFQRDKFSGYDRVEGGSRANVGLRYFGSFNNNWSLYGLIGQSFHIAGKNSFAEKDSINVGFDSGLETTRSDYVAMFGANHDSGFSLASRGRFDKNTGKIHRGEIETSQKWSNFWVAMQYAYIKNQPNYGYEKNRQEISFQTSLQLSDYWSFDNNASYDLVSRTFVKRGISLNYMDECFKMKFGYQQISSPGKNTPLQNFNFSFSLRTLTHTNQKI